jgi:hypothetical protein
MRRRFSALLAGMALLASVGIAPVFAREDSTLTETCSNGTTTVRTTVDASSGNPGNFERGSANFAGKTPLGYVCQIS